MAGLRPVTFAERLTAYGRFLKLMWRAHPTLASLRLFLLVTSSVLQPLSIYVFSILISAIGSGDGARAMVLVPIAVAAYAGHRLANDVLHSYLDSWFHRAVGLKAQDDIFSHLASIPPERLLDPDLRRDLDFAREDLWRVNNLPQYTENALRNLIQIVSAVGLGLLAPPWVLAVVFGVAALQAVLSMSESRRDIWTATWNSLDGRRIEYTKYVFMLGQDFREVRLLDAARIFLKRFRDASRNILSRFRTAAMRSAAGRGALAVIQTVAYGVIITAFVPQAVQDPSKLGLLYIALNLFSLLGDGLNGFASASASLFADLSILARVHHLLTIPVEVDRGKSVPKHPLVIEFRNVSYRYPGATRDAVSRLNLTIREHEHLAVVGRNGAGKSTFLRLLSGLDQPTSGVVLVNGQPLASYKKSEWRRAFHLMLQDAKLYQDYLGENLLYGRGAGKWRNAGLPLPKSLAVSGADAVVREIPDGLGAFVGDWVAPPGIVPVKVSGGQSQRLLISRTLIHGGRIIAFDEPTSAMDALAETAFFERLHATMSGRGLIYISHRFSTVRQATRILVFEDGRLIEDGSHERLLSKGGEYAKLYQEQAKWYQ